jgi:hypothetical protein
MLAADAASSPASAELAKAVVNRQATDLIKEAEAAVDGLHEKLIEDGVVLPDTRGSSSYGDEDDYMHGHWGGMRGGYSSGPIKNYREVYKLRHLHSLDERLKSQSRSLDSTKLKPELAELLARAGDVVPRLEAAGKAAGMLDGGSPAEAVADVVNPLLSAGFEAFDSDMGFVKPLRAKGLAPENGAEEGQQLWRETYDLQQLRGLRAHLMDLGGAGMYTDSDGDTSAMSIDQKKYLVVAIGRLDTIMVKHFKEPAPKDVKLPAALTLARLSVDSDRAKGDAVKQKKLQAEALAYVQTKSTRSSKACTRRRFRLKPRRPSSRLWRAPPAASPPTPSSSRPSRRA